LDRSLSSRTSDPEFNGNATIFPPDCKGKNGNDARNNPFYAPRVEKAAICSAPALRLAACGNPEKAGKGPLVKPPRGQTWDARRFEHMAIFIPAGEYFLLTNIALSD
jgi:hypothetical protein